MCITLPIPVISTSVGGIPEYVNDTNGRLVNAGDEEAFESLLNDYLDKKIKFSKKEIQTESRIAFSAEKIGHELCTIYQGRFNPTVQQIA